MALLGIVRDKETGCVATNGNYQAMETCKQAYFTKQQNQILKQQKVQVVAPTPQITITPSTSEIETRLESMEKQINVLSTQQSITVAPQKPNSDDFINLPVLPLILIFILVIVFTVIITVFISKKRNKSL